MQFYLFILFYVIEANVQMDRLMVCDYRHPWTPLLRGFEPLVLSLTRRNKTQTLFHASVL